MKKELFFILTYLFCLSLVGQKNNETLYEYIKRQKSFVAISNADNLPEYIKKYQPLILDFLTSQKLDKDKYYVSTSVFNNPNEDGKPNPDTTTSHLCLRFYHDDYFALHQKAEQEYAKDSIPTYFKGNTGGKNFRLSIDKTTNKIFGPTKWK